MLIRSSYVRNMRSLYYSKKQNSVTKKRCYI